MKALQIMAFGSTDGVGIEDVPAPQPGPGQVRVRIHAASVNPLDLKIAAGHMQQVFPVTLPYTLGTDFAGVIDAVGPGPARLRPGQRVVGRTEPGAGGAFAETTMVDADALCALPDDMSFEQAAALPTAAGTAWLSLLQVGKLQAGQRVLIHAAAGGVGSFAVQFARQAGAHVVATASARNHELLRTLGADEAIDYRSEDFSARLRGLDLVLDTVGGETLERSWRVLRPGGTIVSTVEFAIQPRGDAHGVFAFFRQDAEVLRSIIGRFAEGRLQVVLDTLHTLDDARAALERAASGHARGKLVLRV